jgi:hypothetical protein
MPAELSLRQELDSSIRTLLAFFVGGCLLAHWPKTAAKVFLLLGGQYLTSYKDEPVRVEQATQLNAELLG